MKLWKNEQRKKWIYILFIGCMGVYSSRIVMPNSSSAISNELDFNKQQIGLILAFFFWGYMCTQYIGGYVSDRIGGEIVISICSMIWSSLLMIFVWIPYFSNQKDSIYGWFLLFRFLFGASQGFFYPSIISIMSKRVGKSTRQSTYSIIVSGNHLGTLLCGSFGSYLLEEYGWRFLFHVIGCTWFIWALILYLNLDISGVKNSDHFSSKSLKEQAKNPGDQLPFAFQGGNLGSNILSQTIEDAKKKAPTKNIILNIDNSRFSNSLDLAKMIEEQRYRPLDWRTLLASSVFWSITAANFAHSNTFFILFTWLPTYFHDSFKDARSWVFNVVPWIIISPSVLLSGYMGDKLIKKNFSLIFVRKFMNTIVLICSSVFLYLLSLTDDYITSLILVSLAIASCGFHTCGVILSSQDIAPAHSGQVYGIVSTIGTLPGFFGVYLAGLILDYTHKWSYVFNITIFINLIGWILFTLYGKADPIV